MENDTENLLGSWKNYVSTATEKVTESFMKLKNHSLLEWKKEDRILKGKQLKKTNGKRKMGRKR